MDSSNRRGFSGRESHLETPASSNSNSKEEPGNGVGEMTVAFSQVNEICQQFHFTYIYIYIIYTYTFFRRKQKCCVSFKLSRFSVSFKLDAASTSPVNSDLVIHVDGQAIPPTNANAPSVYIHIIRAKLKKKALHLGESANFRTHVLRCPWGHTQAVDLCC